MTSTTTGRRPKFNLHRDGFEDCAEHIAVTIGRTGGDFAVYIDARGDVRVIQLKDVMTSSQFGRWGASTGNVGIVTRVHV